MFYTFSRIQAPKTLYCLLNTVPLKSNEVLITNKRVLRHAPVHVKKKLLASASGKKDKTDKFGDLLHKVIKEHILLINNFFPDLLLVIANLLKLTSPTGRHRSFGKLATT